jgi:hypothetical protein
LSDKFLQTPIWRSIAALDERSAALDSGRQAGLQRRKREAVIPVGACPAIINPEKGPLLPALDAARAS